MKNLLLSCSFLLCSLCCLAQFTISGKVVDAESKEPLAGASVFAQNTTRGTVTNAAGEFSLSLDKGGYELIISFTGYDNQTLTINGVSETFAIELKKSDNSMSEVIIKNSAEVPDGWEKYGTLFLKSFIGATPFADSCILLNPEALKFLYYKRNDRLKILASEPLQVRNGALGYNIRYQLDSLVYYNQTGLYSYRGQCFFMEIDTTAEQKEVWLNNRRQAYYGSRLHFLRAYYDSTLIAEGFKVDVLSKNIANKFDRLVNPYDSTYYFFDRETGDAELFFPMRASISYEKKAPEKEYLSQYGLPSNVGIQLSYIDLRDAIIIKPNGYFFDQSAWMSRGYWSWKNLADMLPYDYEPQ